MTKPWFPIITSDNFLSNDEIKQRQPDDDRLEKFEKIETADHWLYEIEKRIKKTIDAAENVIELDENDIKYLLVSYAIRMIGLDIIPAERSNAIDDFIIANNLPPT